MDDNRRKQTEEFLRKVQRRGTGTPDAETMENFVDEAEQVAQLLPGDEDMRILLDPSTGELVLGRIGPAPRASVGAIRPLGLAEELARGR